MEKKNLKLKWKSLDYSISEFKTIYEWMQIITAIKKCDNTKLYPTVQ